jgi:hypothetical protein
LLEVEWAVDELFQLPRLFGRPLEHATFTKMMSACRRLAAPNVRLARHILDAIRWLFESLPLVFCLSMTYMDCHPLIGFVRRRMVHWLRPFALYYDRSESIDHATCQ